MIYIRNCQFGLRKYAEGGTLNDHVAVVAALVTELEISVRNCEGEGVKRTEIGCLD